MIGEERGWMDNERLARLARVFAAYQTGTLEPHELNTLLTAAWSAAPATLSIPGVTKRELVAMFRAAGFVTNRPGYERPTVPMLVYRGATPQGALGFSWSPRRDYAARFACGAQQQYGEGVLLETTVRPYQMLGVLFLGAMAMEVIVNPFTLRRANLHVTPAQDADVLASAEASERSLIAARQMLVKLKDQIETIKEGMHTLDTPAA